MDYEEINFESNQEMWMGYEEWVDLIKPLAEEKDLINE